MRLLATTLALGLSACGGASNTGSSGMSNCPTGTTAVTVGPGSYYGSQNVFSPSSVTISAGSTVCWEWGTSGHSVTSGTNGVADGTFCSPSNTNCSAGATSPAGTVYTHKFTTAGTFPYFCSVHWSMGMTGTVIVQ